MPSLPRLPRLPLVLVLIAGALPAAFSQCSATLNIVIPRPADADVSFPIAQSVCWPDDNGGRTPIRALDPMVGVEHSCRKHMHGSAHITRTIVSQWKDAQPRAEHSRLDFICWGHYISRHLAWRLLCHPYSSNGHSRTPPPPRYQETEFKSLWTSTAAPRRAKRASNYDIVIG